jgi:predicted PurR-regulated permease PerM
MVTENQYQKIVPFIIFVLALVLLFLLVRSMITIILGSILLAYVSFPIYKRISKKIHKKFPSIVLSLIIVSIIILIPLTFLTIEVAHEGASFYNSLSDTITKGALFGFGCTSSDSTICSFLNHVEKISLDSLSKFGFDKQLQKLLPALEEKIANFILSIPLIIAQILLSLVIAYFILKDWENILKKIVDLLPMRKETVDKLTTDFSSIAHTVIYAQLFVALVQGVIAAIGFYLFGVPLPIFFGVLVAFCSLIPAIGTAIIWVPVSLFMALSGYLSHDYSMLGKGIGLFFYCLLIISVIDNFLLARIVHSKTKVNQILVIIGVVGGASLFGVVGIFIGPILLPLLITYFRAFKERFD